MQSMKLFALIMSLVILALVGKPCSDGSMLNDHKANETHAGVEPHENHAGEGHSDACSPLCVCACCSIVCINTPIVFVELEKIPVYLEHTAYYAASPIEIATTVWQPPQLNA